LHPSAVQRQEHRTNQRPRHQYRGDRVLYDRRTTHSRQAPERRHDHVRYDGTWQLKNCFRAKWSSRAENASKQGIAFSSEVETGSRKENASNQQRRLKHMSARILVMEDVAAQTTE